MYRIGIDLGGTNIAAGIVNSEFKIVAKASVPTVVTEGADKVASDIANLCKKITADNGIALFCCGDQVRKGAATNAVQIAELFVK